ncbi:hypothetical protein K3495_g1513 [Podosphaera aphanis]|nr:hypothetical protein K3495_g1513 [Podosphaera aphanis]
MAKRVSTDAGLNFYSGENSLREYYDPDLQLPLPLVEIPRKLNPFYNDGVRIYAKMLTALPANNVKSLPALNMLQSPHVSSNTKTLVEYSSGSTVISMSILARILYGIDDTHAFMSNRSTPKKLQLMRFFGLNVTLFGGPSEPLPDDHRGGIGRARNIAKENPTVTNLNQYENDLNWKSHVRWTGPQLLKQLPCLKVFCAGLGTTGTLTGVGMYMKEHRPEVVRVGVATAPNDRIPGLRTYATLAYEFPWKDIVDLVVEVGSPDAYGLSMELSREGLICGPSSGSNLQGLYDFFERRKRANNLRQLAGEDGLIHSVFICCDLPYQYLEEYFEKLSFPDLINQNLLHVDTHFYDKAWEVDLETFLPKIYPAISGVPGVTKWHEILRSPTLEIAAGIRIVDLRSSFDFDTLHLPYAASKPLDSVTVETPSPYYDSDIMEVVWRELEVVFASCATVYGTGKDGGLVVLICYDGDVSRVASSVLQARGVRAVSLKDGMRGVHKYLTGPEQRIAKDKSEKFMISGQKIKTSVT